MAPVAATARAAGAEWLGVALPSEAMALRATGDTGPLLAWLYVPGDPDLVPCVAADVDLSVSAPWALAEVVAAARAVGRPARVHLKVDTGLGRGGAPREAWADLLDLALRAAAEGVVDVVAVWSHLACADEPGHPATQAQVDAFDEALALAARAGLRPPLRHLASTGAVLATPRTHYDLVRPGIGIYGLSPGPTLGTSADLGLRPAMTLTAEVALVKRLPAGHGVSYGLAWTAPTETTVALVPVGYGDGIPRTAVDARVGIQGRHRPVRGRIAMDQVVVEVRDDEVVAGDPVVVFGPGTAGEPTVADWARATGTIDYEIVTRLGPRVPREYVRGAS
jgi:alanine racemase